MALTWKKLADLAKEKLKVEEPEFRRLLGKNDVASATITNWKGGRPIPHHTFPMLSTLLGVSIDELHGRGPGSNPELTDEGAEAIQLARQILSLDDDARRSIKALVVRLSPPATRRAPRRTSRAR